MNAPRNRPIKHRLCSREKHPNVAILSCSHQQRLQNRHTSSDIRTKKHLPARTHPKWRSGNIPTPRARIHCAKTSLPASTNPPNEATSVGLNGPGGCSGNWPGEAKSSMATMTVHDGFGFAPEPPIPGQTGFLCPVAAERMLTECIASRCLHRLEPSRGSCVGREEFEILIVVPSNFLVE